MALALAFSAARSQEFEVPPPLIKSPLGMTQELDDTALSVTILTREDIRLSGALTLAEVLRVAVGLDVASFGPSYGSIGIRGHHGPLRQHVAVFLDGIDVSNRALGTTFLEALPVSLEEIDRIEVIRGPVSAVWGAGAVGGAVHVFTRPTEDISGTTIQITGAERETWEGVLAQGGATDRLDYLVTGVWDEADAWAVDREVLSSLKARGRFGLALADGGRMELHLGAVGLEGPAASELGPFDRELRQGFAVLTYQRERLQARVGYRFLDADLGLGAETHDLQTSGPWGEVRWEVPWQEHRLSIGGLFRRDEVEGSLVGDGGESQAALNAAGVFALSERWEATIALGVDRQSGAGTEGSAVLGVIGRPASRHTVRASLSLGTGFPALIDPRLGATVAGRQLDSNPDVTAERLLSGELGYRFRLSDRWFADFALFRSEWEDELYLEDRGAIRHANHAESTRDSGGELTLQAAFTDEWSAQLSYAVQDSERLVDGGLDRWPEHRGVASVRWYRANSFEGQLSVHQVGDWVSRGSRIDSHTSVWFKGGMWFGYGRAALHLFGQNILGEEHAEVPGGDLLDRKIGLTFTIAYF